MKTNHSIKIKIDIDPAVSEPEVIIRAKEDSGLIEKIVSAVQECAGNRRSRVAVFRDGAMHLIYQKNIIRVYTENRKLIIFTPDGEYFMRCTLRDLEETLDPNWFVRISRFEILNVNKVSSFDLSMTGTIHVFFEDGSSTWVARRYVRAVEQRLALPRQKGGSGDE